MAWINSSWLFRGKLVITLTIVGLIALIPVIGVARSTSNTQTKPTVVLVHGTFADAAGWNGVIERLQDRGYTVIAVANPLRSLASDSAYLSSILETIKGNIVLVGHSYGGAVLTNAATGRSNVRKLVYIAAFAPDAGETVGGLLSMNPGSMLVPANLVLRPHPGGTDGYIQPNRFSPPTSIERLLRCWPPDNVPPIYDL